MTAKLTLNGVLIFFIIFFLSLSLKRAHSETELDTETPRKKIFLSAPKVSFFLYTLSARKGPKVRHLKIETQLNY